MIPRLTSSSPASAYAFIFLEDQPQMDQMALEIKEKGDPIVIIDLLGSYVSLQHRLVV